MHSLTRFALFVGAALVLLGALPALQAQVESFTTTNLPAGWTMRPGNVNNMWAVDGTPGVTPAGTGGTAFTPYVSAPFSLNFNNGQGNVYSGNSNLTDSGVCMPPVDLSFAPNPELNFQQFMSRFYYSTLHYNLAQVRFWDPTMTTLHQSVSVTCTANPICNWTPVVLQMQRTWGATVVEFRYYSTHLSSTADQNSVGWFIDDVSVTGLLPPLFAIGNSSIIPQSQVGGSVNEQFTAQNGTQPYVNWRITAGALPPGLTLDNNTGSLTGTPTDSGNYAFTVTVDDSSAPALVAHKPCTMVITRSPSFTYPISQLPWDDDFATDKGWVFTEGNPTTMAIHGPGAAPYSDVSTGGWERGAASPSPLGSWNQDNGDPALDNSIPGTDNMIMGVKVGGQWPVTATAGITYGAYSPELEISGLRYVDVKFARWVNAHYQYLTTKVDIWNPMTNQWQELWKVTSNTDDHDNAWKQESISHDFGAVPQGGDSTRVRFVWSFMPQAIPAYTSGGFNIDDVKVLEKPQPGILKIVEARVLSPHPPATAPRTFVGVQYPFLLRVENTSQVDVDISSFSFGFYTIAARVRTPETVGTFLFSQPPSAANPWRVPPGIHVVSNDPATPGIVDIQFDCTAIASVGNGGTVFLNVELIGREVMASPPNTTPRSTVSNTATDVVAGDSRISPSQNPQVEITDNQNLPAANLGQPYVYTFTAQFGTPPYVNWDMPVGPPWITFDPNTHSISGTPPAAQPYQLTVSVNDSGSPQGFTQKVFTINVVNVGPLPISISTSSQLPNAVENLGYGPVTFNATGGTPPYTWQLMTGTLPLGVTFTAGSASLGGLPQSGTTGAYSFQIRARDSAVPQSEVIRTFYLSVLPENQNVAITTPTGGAGSPPEGLETAPYNGGVPFQFNASGGFVSGPNSYRWTIVSGNWPPGLILDPVTGQVSGIPTTQGTYGFNLRVADGAFPPSTAELSFAIRVNPLIAAPLTITSNAVLPGGDEGNLYATRLTANYGEPPYTWRLKAGSVLPAGLVINPSTGDLSGVITTNQAANPDQDFVFTIEVLDTDVPVQIAEKVFTLNVKAFINGILTVTTPEDLPEAGVQTPYSVWLKATGGTPVDLFAPYQWVLAPGQVLPPGLTLDINGHLSGAVPLHSHGEYTFQIDVSDGAGHDSARIFTLQVNDYWKPPQEGAVEIEAGRERTDLVPFWEACSISAGAGASGMAVFGVLYLFAAIRRRRK